MKGAQLQNPMSLQPSEKRSPPDGLGHLEFFFYDSDLFHGNQSGLLLSDEVGSTPHSEVPDALMPNWPGYGDEPLTEWIINDGDDGAIFQNDSVDNSVCGNLKDEFSNPQPKQNTPTDLTVVSSEQIDVAVAVECSLGKKEEHRQSVDVEGTCLSVAAPESTLDRSYSQLSPSANKPVMSTLEKIVALSNVKSTHRVQKVSELKLSTQIVKLLLSLRGSLNRMAIFSCIQMFRMIRRTMEHHIVASVKGCTSEMMLYMADRAKCLSDEYLTAIVSDDPEHLHIQRLLLVREAVWGWVHQHSCFLSSLPWHQRQLLGVTRDLDKHIEIATSKLVPRMLKFGSTIVNDGVMELCNEALRVRDYMRHGKKLSLSSSGVDCPDCTREGNEDLDEEDQYALSRWFTQPAFQKSSQCSTCSRPFSMSLFRHHCRCCGLSHCTLHSSQRRPLLRLGIGLVSPVRVCDKCAVAVDNEVHIDTLIWRKMRVEAYLNTGHAHIKDRRDMKSDLHFSETATSLDESDCTQSESNGEGLIPYNEKCVDRNVDKMIRVADYSLKVIKSTVSLNYPTKLALHTVDILKRYGLSGLAGVLLRKDFMEAVEMLKRISGIDHMFSLSLHELTACIYYKLAIDRGLRGCDPDGEHNTHRALSVTAAKQPIESADKVPTDNTDTDTPPHLSPISSTATSWSGSTCNNKCEEAEEWELNEVIRLAPLALSAVYEESPADMQRLALAQGWTTVFISSQSAPEQPAYTLFASSDKEGTKEVVLSVRGTASVEDIVTDIRAAPQKFPPSEEDVQMALQPDLQTHFNCRPGSDAVQGRGDGAERDNEGWMVISSDTDLGSDSGIEEEEELYACGGMARAAYWLLGQVGPALLQLYSEGFHVILVGHSMGGAVAALLCHLLRGHLLLSSSTPSHTNNATPSVRTDIVPDIRCITYGCPSSMCDRLADSMAGYVTSVVLHDDVVSRITPESIRLLLRELLVFRQQVFRHIRQDWSDVIARARDLWSPKKRDIAVRPSAYQSHSSPLPSAPNSTSIRNNASTAEEVEDGDGDVAVVEDEERDEWIPSLWLPGKIMHIYSHCGQYKVAKVPRTLLTLRKIEVQGNIFTDHVSQTIFDALLEVRAVRAADRAFFRNSTSHKNDGIDESSSGGRRRERERATARGSKTEQEQEQEQGGGRIQGPPVWTPYDKSVLCTCCNSPFTWHSTFKGEAQEYRERYNCRHCGGLVCGPCSSKRRAIPRLGLLLPSRMCDKCFHKGDYSHI